MAEHAHTTPTLTPHVTAATSPPSRRRTLFAAAGAVVFGSGITAGAAASVADLVEQPDADLLALCAKAEEADCLMWAACNQSKTCPTEAGRAELRRESDSWFDRFVDHVDEAACIPARTVDGLRAKARVAYLNNNKTPEDDDLTALILRDIGWGA